MSYGSDRPFDKTCDRCLLQYLNEIAWYNHFHDVHGEPIGLSHVNMCLCDRCNTFTLTHGAHLNFRRQADALVPVFEAQSAADRAFRASALAQSQAVRDQSSPPIPQPEVKLEEAEFKPVLDPALGSNHNVKREQPIKPEQEPMSMFSPPQQESSARSSLRRRSRAPSPEPATSPIQMPQPSTGNNPLFDFTFRPYFKPKPPPPPPPPVRIPQSSSTPNLHSGTFNTTTEPRADNPVDISSFTFGATAGSSSRNDMPPPPRPRETQQTSRVFAQPRKRCDKCIKGHRKCNH